MVFGILYSKVLCRDCGYLCCCVVCVLPEFECTLLCAVCHIIWSSPWSHVGSWDSDGADASCKYISLMLKLKYYLHVSQFRSFVNFKMMYMMAPVTFPFLLQGGRQRLCASQYFVRLFKARSLSTCDATLVTLGCRLCKIDMSQDHITIVFCVLLQIFSLSFSRITKGFSLYYLSNLSSLVGSEGIERIS